MSESAKPVEITAFDAARIRAIDNYAMLEFCLAGLLRPLLGVKKQAYTVFYRISNTRARYAIIEALLRDADESDAHKFWKSIEKKLTKIDSTRNNIVHWQAVAELGVVGGPDHLRQEPEKFLRPGHSFDFKTKLNIDDIHNFTADTSMVTSLVNVLCMYLDGHITDDKKEAMKEIFCKPITNVSAKKLLDLVYSSYR